MSSEDNVESPAAEADACVAALDASDGGSLCNTTLSVASIEGDGPGLDVALWEERARAAL